MLARQSCWSENEGLGGFRILEADAPQRCLEALVRVEARKDDTLVTDRRRRAPAHTMAGRCRSGSGQNRHRCASRAPRWHWPAYCEPPPNESRDDRAWNFVRAGILRCPEGSPEKSTVRRPCTGIDPGTRRTSL